MRGKLVEYLKDNKDQIIETWLTDLELPVPASQPAAHSEKKDCTCGGACTSLKNLSCSHTRAPAPSVVEAPELHGTVTVSYLAGALDAVTAHIASSGELCDAVKRPHFEEFIGITATCADGNLAGRVCIDLYSAGYRAFRSIFTDGWDSNAEFTEADQEACMDLIQSALISTLRRDIELCELREEREDCPFAVQ